MVKAIYFHISVQRPQHLPQQLHQARGTSKVCPEALLDLVGEEAGPVQILWELQTLFCSAADHDI